MKTIKGTYRKAFTDGKRLKSYDTIICSVQDGEVKFTEEYRNYLLLNGWSATTGRHICNFCGLNKSQVLQKMNLKAVGRFEIVEQ